MPTLSSSLVKHQVASMEDVDAALSRQAQYGGDLVTNLLELGGVSEERLTRLLAESNGLEPAPFGQLPRAPDGVRRLVPGELAQRYAFYPLNEQSGALSIAVSEPLPGEVESDMAFSLGVTIVQRVAPLVRVREALARDYGAPLEQRMERALSCMGGGAEPSRAGPSHGAGEAGMTGIRPATLNPPQALKTPLVPKQVEPTPTPAPAEAAPDPRPSVFPNLATLARREPAARANKRRGPYTVAMAEQDLLDVETRDDVLRALIDFAAQYFEYTAIFAVHGDLAEGRDASGPGASRAKLCSIGVSLDLPSALASARDSAGPLLVSLRAEGLDLALTKDLERRPGRLVLLLPVRVRSRCVLILYGDHGESDVSLAGVGDVLSFAPLVSAAIERLILQRKRPGAPAGATIAPPAPARRQKQPLPSAEERAQALASALDTRGSIRPSRPPPVVLAEPEPAVPRIPHGRPSVPSVGAQPSHDSEPPRSIADALRHTPSGEFKGESKTRPGVGGGLTPDPPAPKLPFSSEPTPAPQVVSPEVAPALRAVSSQRLELVSEPDDDDDTQELNDDDVDGAWTLDQDGIPSSRTESHPAVPLARPAQSSELKLPSVIVDLANDCRVLVDQLVQGDEAAGDRLVEIGTTAVTVLAGAFPGPIKQRSVQPGAEAPKASECGPILRTLRRLAHKSVPFVIVRTNDVDPVVRRWATLLLGELPTQESVHAVSRRFFDTDDDVRSSALAAGRMFLPHPDFGRAFVGEFGAIAQDSKKGAGMRLAAIEALADLRHPLCVPELIHVLPVGPSEVAQAASRALSVITRQDFGVNGASWAEWWRANGGRHRIEWLIEALTHDAQDIRRPAGEELKALTREYFGYYDDLPPRERERAQMRYREWWESRGKARFH